MNNDLIDLTINLVTSTPQDAINQNELLNIYEELKPYGANLVPLKSDVLPIYNRKAGSTEIDILIDAVHIVLSEGTVIAILLAFIKNYFDTFKSKLLEIKTPDGISVKITGYNGEETDKMLQTLLNSKQRFETNS